LNQLLVVIQFSRRLVPGDLALGVVLPSDTGSPPQPTVEEVVVSDIYRTFGASTRQGE
jgi:hypothetical protein